MIGRRRRMVEISIFLLCFRIFSIQELGQSHNLEERSLVVIPSIPHSRPILWSTQYKGKWKSCVIRQKMIVPLNANVTTQFSLKNSESDCLYFKEIVFRPFFVVIHDNELRHNSKTYRRSPVNFKRFESNYFLETKRWFTPTFFSNCDYSIYILNAPVNHTVALSGMPSWPSSRKNIQYFPCS